MGSCRLALLVLGLMLFGLGQAGAASPPTLELFEQQAASHALLPYLSLYENAPPGLGIDEISSEQSAARFVPPPAQLPGSGVHWLRLRLHVGQHSHARWLFLFERQPPRGALISLYQTRYGVWHEHTVGGLTPMSMRPVRDVLVLFPISALPATSAELFVRIDLSQSRDFNLSGLMSILTYEHYYVNKVYEWLFQGFFFGVLGIMAFYNIMLYFSVRDRSYLWLVLSMLGYTCYFLSWSGVGGELFWSERPLIDYGFIAAPVGGALMVVSSGRFIMHYLRIVNTQSIVRFLFNFSGALMIFEALRNIIFISLGYLPFFRIYNLNSLLTVCVGLYAILEKVRKGDRPAYFLLVATVLLAVGAVVQFLYASQVLAPGLIVRHALQVGVGGQVALLSLGLADRLRLIRQELREREKSERLLHAMLPAPIANRLKAGESPIADRFAEVTVLFADIVGFTTLSSRLLPEQVVRTLNRLFSRFDALVSARGLEKIKTIGDCYMVVGGLPTPRSDHAEAVAELALAFLTAIEPSGNESGSENSDVHAVAEHVEVRMRIGLHCGSVVAGVIGTHKPAYDLWGDTVNTASRMESHGEAGRIHCTEAVYEKLKHAYHFEERGTVEVRGKGMMRTFFLHARTTT